MDDTYQEFTEDFGDSRGQRKGEKSLWQKLYIKKSTSYGQN